MRTIICILLSCILAASCDKTGEGFDVRLDILNGMDTKSMSASEKKINNLDIFAFGLDNGIFISQRYEGSDEVVINLPSGRYELWAIANIPFLPAIDSKEELMELSMAYSSNTPDSFIMRNKEAVIINVRNDMKETVSIARLCSRISVSGSIKVDFSSSSSLSSAEAEILSCFVLNIPESCEVYGGGTSESMVNDGSVSISDGKVYGEGEGMFYTNAGSSSKEFTPPALYAYPNPASESSDPSIQDYVTKYVIAVRAKNRIYYYPIGIPEMEANHDYEISNVKITGKGSYAPNSYLQDPLVISFTLKPKRWADRSDQTIII